VTRITIELPHVYGANADAYDCHDPEVILAGPADTGKTVALLTKIHWLANAYPGASLVILRKQLTDVFPTVLVTYKNYLLGENGHVRAYGGEKPQWYDFPNGSRVWVAGLDKSSKVLSAEHDVVYVNQAEELSLPDWEYLTTRTTGRAGHVKYPQVIGDCNPAHPTHWIVTRAREGKLTKFDSTHRDNPDLYDQATGELTPEGEHRIGALKRLSGERLLRLYHGLWAAPEGAIYGIFDEEKHKVQAFTPSPLWPRVVGIDPFGAYIAAIWLAFDPQNAKLNVYREYSEPFGLTTPGHVRNILDASRGETIFAWVGGGPSERQARTDFVWAGIPLLAPPISDVWAGIDRVYQLLRDFSLVIHDSCPQLLSEIGSYRRKMRDGQPTETIADKESFHLLDALRYVVAWLTDAELTRIIYAPDVGMRY
jgi:hypothetical protein